jgi:hypothetical protein
MSRRDDPADSGPAERGQSHVIGVAVLLAATMLSLATLTAGVGVVIEDTAAAADAGRVAADLDSSLEPVAATGHQRGRVSFTDGQLRVVERTLRVLDADGEVFRTDVDALVFTAGESRVAFVAGMVVRGSAGNAAVHTVPPVASGEGVLLVGVARLNASGPDTVSATHPTTVPLRTTVTHERRSLGEGEFRVAVETATPGPWERHFLERGATPTRRDFDGDGVPSVVGAYPGNRTGYLVVHDLALEVGA